MEGDKKIARVAHDNKKADLVAWAKHNRLLLARHQIYATGTTGTILERELGFFVWHLFVLAGTACHVVAVLRYAAERRGGWHAPRGSARVEAGKRAKAESKGEPWNPM